jgi:hypothetical protein
LANTKLKRYLLKFTKILGWVVGSIVLLLLLINVAIRIPAVQNFIVGKAVNILSEQTGTEIRLKHIVISFPKTIVVEGLYAEDLKKDTLVYLGQLKVNAGLMGLLRKEIHVQKISLSNTTVRLYRQPGDSAFNFSFIADSLSSSEPDTTPPDTTARPWKFALDNLSLSDIRFSFLDSLSGFNISTQLGQLDLSMDELRLDTLTFGVDKISLSKTDIKLAMYGEKQDSESESSGEPPAITVDEIELHQVNFQMKDLTNQLELKANTDQLKIITEEVNLKKQRIVLDELVYRNAEVLFSHHNLPAEDTSNAYKTKQKGQSLSVPWYFGVKEMDLNNLDFSMQNTAFPDTLKGFDPDHLHFTHLDLEGKDLVFAGLDMEANISNLNFREGHGFELNKLAGIFALSDSSASIKDFILITDKTAIRQNAFFTFPGLNEISNRLGEVTTDIELTMDKLGKNDISYFMPGLLDSLPFNIDSLNPLNFYANIKGRVQSLDISEISLSLMDSTSLYVKGTVFGLPETGNLQAEMADFKFVTSKNDLEKILPDSILPEGVQIPASIGIFAGMEGNLNDFQTDLNLETSFGKISINGHIQEFGQQNPEYKFSLNTESFDLGRLLKDTTQFGNLSINLDVDGLGFDPMKMKTDAEIGFDTFHFQGYEYNNIHLSAGADSGTFNLKGTIRDEYVDLTLNGQLVYDSINPEINLITELKGINLQELGISENDIRAQGKLTVHLKGSTASNLNGKIDTRDVLIIKNNDLYPVDSLVLISINDSVKSELKIQSDFLSANYTGTLSLDKLGNVLIHHLNQYFLISNDSVYVPGENNFQFEVNLKSSSLLTQVLIPGLEKFDPGHITGEFDESENRFQMNGNLPLISYQGTQVKDVNFEISSGQSELTTDLTIGQVKIPGYYISGIGFSSGISDNTIHGTLNLQEKDDESWAYEVPFKLRRSDTLYLLSFTGDQLVINSKNWTFRDNEEIQLSDLASGNYELNLESREEKINISGKGNRFKAGLTNFRMSNLGNILRSQSGDTVLQGIAQGDLIINQTEGISNLNVDFTINNLRLLEIPFGNLQLNLQGKQPGNLAGSLKISEINDLRLELKEFSLDTNKTLHANLFINKFELSSLNGFLPNESDSLFGWLGGEFKLGNTIDNPLINGEIVFHDVNTELSTYGTFIQIDDQKIRFNDNNIVFPGFTIRDQDNGQMTLDGRITSENFENFKLNLQVKATDFKAINKVEDQEGLYYGTLVFSTNTKVNGTMNDIRVDAGLTINEETDFSMNLLESTPTESSYEGVVRFVDKDRSLNPILIDTTEQTVEFRQQNITATANIEIEEKASLAMVVDPRAGDRLWVRGSANLTFTLDETGIPSLSGRYNLNDGGYRLTLFEITQREFGLMDGSYIQWSGDPMDARLQIDATYQVETSPYNLIIDQTNQTSGNDQKQYRQKLPFTVFLMIRGEISEPIIDFKIELPEDKKAAYNGVVQSKLDELKAPGNESSMNKQVLSLLAFKQFMPPNPMELGGESSGISAAARSSVSRLLSNQLNQFSEKYIKGVSVDFDVQSYEQYDETGSLEERTELGIALSRSFFENRLEVSVGSNVELESDEYRKENDFNDIAEDIEVVYKLTKNGVYRVKAFRYNEYEQFEGDITQSGVSFIFNRDFNYLNQLFSDDEEKQEKTDKKKKVKNRKDQDGKN